MEETKNPLTTATEPAVMSPLTRWIRTVLQVLAGLVVSVPVAASLVGLPATTSVKAVGIMGAIVAIVSGIQNALNSKGSKG